ncbi:hypothetical protein ACJXM4_02660 [Streptococcus pneumoniae]
MPNTGTADSTVAMVVAAASALPWSCRPSS